MPSYATTGGAPFRLQRASERDNPKAMPCCSLNNNCCPTHLLLPGRMLHCMVEKHSRMQCYSQWASHAREKISERVEALMGQETPQYVQG